MIPSALLVPPEALLALLLPMWRLVTFHGGGLGQLGRDQGPRHLNQQTINNEDDDPQTKSSPALITQEKKIMRFNRFSRFVAAALFAALVFTSGPAFAAAHVPTGKVNLNTATLSQLEDLPGIGPALAARIIEHRQKNGGFKSVEDVMAVKGIGEKNFAKIQGFLSVGSPAASKETPKQ